jgi:membrane dipeptidase
MSRLIFDGHVDLALYGLGHNRDITETVAQINQREQGMTDTPDRGFAVMSLPEMRRGRVAVCQSTVAARTNRDLRPTLRTSLDYATPAITYAQAQGQLAYYRMLSEQGEMRLLRTADELDDHWREWENGTPESLPVGVIVSMECADPIVEPADAEGWYADGVRSVSLAHFGVARYAYGTGSSGPINDRTRELLTEFERIGMVLDLTHTSDPSFFEAMDHFSGQVIASHSNCRALVPHERQFSDQQLKMLLERDAVIGSAMDAWMLVPGFVPFETEPGDLQLAAVVDHIDHVCQVAGDSLHAAIGSDTGAYNHMPADFVTSADLQRLEATMQERGYSDGDIDNLFHGNWLRFFRAVMPT